MPLIIPANTLSTGGYEVANSCRFNDDDTAFLSKTFSGDGTHHDKGTVSFWLKRGELGAEQGIFTAGSSDRNFIRIESDDTLTFRSVTDSFHLQTTQVFRDSSAWYSIIIAYDTSQGTEGNRVKFYVNGTQVTSFGTETYPSQNLDIKLGAAELNAIGKDSEQTTPYLDGYLSEFVYIDGTQLTPTSFGEFDEDSPTIWKPIDVSGLTFGTNGFYLDFEDSGDLGDDESGNTNDFAETNLAATDQTTDTPTNNFCTFNPLSTLSGPTLSEGNTQFDHDNGDAATFGTMGMANGKWYWEIKALGADVDSVQKWTPGIIGADDHTLYSNRDGGYAPKATSVYLGNGNVYENNSSVSSDYDTAAQNDIISIAVDMDNLKIYFAKNGTWMNSGDPTSGATGTGAVALTASFAPYLPIVGEGSGAAISFAVNFGNPAFTISSGNADGNGYGNFEYAPPSGYYALCTKNLAEYG